MKITRETLIEAPEGATLTRASIDGQSVLTWTKQKYALSGWTRPDAVEGDWVSSADLYAYMRGMGGTWILTITDNL